MARQREHQFERHMSDSEALMWNLEKDPALSSWFASLTILDRPPSMERFRARIAHAAAEVPRLRQRVAASVGRLSPPMWVDDPTFDLDHHIWRVAVPAPGTDEDLHELAVRLLVEPFERTRPLWQFVIIEGLADGRAALFQKMHHTITDGEGGVRLAERFVDLDRDPSEPEPAELPMPVAEIEGFGDAAREVLGHNVRRVGGLAQRVARSVVLNPVGTARGLGLAARELDRSLRPSHDEGTSVGSPLWQPRTLKRWFGTLRVPLDDVKRAGKALGGTVNDVFVAGALAGATTYHLEREVALDRMRVAMPVSTRRGGTVGGNSFAITTTDVDAHGDPVEALAAVHDALAATRGGGSVDLVGELAMVVNLLPTSVLTSFAKDAAATVDFTVSNVRGAPIELYIAGARCEGLFPLGPVSGTAFNLTTVSYAGDLDMGLVVDAGAVDDPPALRDHLAAAYRALLAA